MARAAVRNSMPMSRWQGPREGRRGCEGRPMRLQIRVGLRNGGRAGVGTPLLRRCTSHVAEDTPRERPQGELRSHGVKSRVYTGRER